MKALKNVSLMMMAAAAAWAGPTLACHSWVAPTGSAFAAIEPLRNEAMNVANHNNVLAAVKRAAELRTAVREGDAQSMLLAGYWIEFLHAIRVIPDADGPALIRKAADLRPQDAEYQFFAGLGSFDTDKANYKKYWERARALAAPGSAASQNLREFDKALAERMPKSGD